VTFGSATTATLTATPASGYVFTSWGGSCAGTSATTAVLVDAVKTCSATFTASGGGGNGPWPLTISPVPTGGTVESAGIRCGTGGSACSWSFPNGAAPGLVAIASVGYVFGGWTGDCGGTNRTTVVTMTGPRACGAIFTPTGGAPVYSMTISPVPVGGTVDFVGLRCGDNGASCVYSSQVSRVLEMTPVPTPGYTFAGWGGDCAGMGQNTIFFTLTGVHTCSATFARQ
jgi:uncharacterized repeat protein (TIGR02543 family)